MSWLLMVWCATACTVAAVWWVLRRAGRPPSHRTTSRPHLLRRRPPAPDPLATLALQVRLSELAAEMRRIEADPDVYARAHHYLAVQGAYDALLREACRLTGLSVEDAPLRAGFRTGDDERFREELELSARGWSW
ncbi:hypothetical protein JOE63_000983 [Cellulosimicrobium cellulans]|jgi:hypothetical protein|uniref:hypothetical protein n=1 Tax=Cellulosimicrobium cellulans TaxID=1710 RepID=UPI001EF92720|nr:hypothetical protein [Cellulosimicrobium cellulans]MBM7818506.1 hypothetical protein [Cellulosimicrobium cellulans]